ncbi:DUF262 domain-containing protein [Paenibacillus vini]|uniref:DUF262 domain-containing protein n=1 Tax=Paenibacillus vini TaxID=1476024 RepID=UPI0025B65766|nr:DUF262 domain-containing protein [Paenibacillus vini]MDN4067759.1 DUF262 domain-containing protein [Paenibacillus vini]
MNGNISANDIKKAEKQILEQQARVDYDIRDFPIAFIVENFDQGEYFVPEYQREFVWGEDYKVRLIESLLLGLPIPLIFLSDTESGELEIVDGVQRISTLSAFLNNDLKLSGLKKLDSINGFYFKNLPPSQQRKLNSKSLRVIVLRSNTSEDIRKELFNRLNTSSLKASDSEVRKGSFGGEFLDFIIGLAEMPELLQVAPISEKLLKRQENIELILRFFAYSNNYKEFKHGVQSFINEYIESEQENFDAPLMEKEYRRMLEFARRYFPNGFRKNKDAKSTPRVRFEALAVGINLALRENENLVPKGIERWLNSDDFKSLTTSDGSNSKTRVKKRIEFVRDKLLNGE